MNARLRIAIFSRAFGHAAVEDMSKRAVKKLQGAEFRYFDDAIFAIDTALKTDGPLIQGQGLIVVLETIDTGIVLLRCEFRGKD